MKERIMTYLKEHGKSNVNDLAAALEMAELNTFPVSLKPFPKWKVKGFYGFQMMVA